MPETVWPLTTPNCFLQLYFTTGETEAESDKRKAQSSGDGTYIQVFSLCDAATCSLLLVPPATRSWPSPQRLDAEQPLPVLAAMAFSGVCETSSRASACLRLARGMSCTG